MVTPTTRLALFISNTVGFIFGQSIKPILSSLHKSPSNSNKPEAKERPAPLHNNNLVEYILINLICNNQKMVFDL